VLVETFNADTFRRTMLPGLIATGQWRKGARGKPAELYLRA
jgi:8-oxo-dGTP diphosphatase